ncbi:MAG: hypothetical protein C0501_27495 [Isosphaera sp.]|nr:hypothetical protein [Isosphaera sp.]
MRSTLKAVAVFGLAASAFLVATAQDRPPDGGQKDKGAGGKEGAAPLEGGYTIVSGERDGKAIPEAEIKGSVVRFSGNKITGTDKDRKEFFAATYTVTGDKGGDKGPWTIKMKSTSPKDAEAVGMVKKDGDTVTIVYALPGGEAPKEFKTKEKQNLFVLKNMNRDGKKDGKEKE